MLRYTLENAMVCAHMSYRNYIVIQYFGHNKHFGSLALPLIIFLLNFSIMFVNASVQYEIIVICTFKLDRYRHLPLLPGNELRVAPAYEDPVRLGSAPSWLTHLERGEEWDGKHLD